MTIRILEAAIFCSIQDQGRFGYQRYGMPESGPMDWWAFQAANRLLGNSADCACIEFGISSTALLIEQDTLIAVCGCGYRLMINDRPLPLWMAIWVAAGTQLRLEKITGGNWVYLAVAGGIRSESWLGSRSVYPRASLGEMLTGGNILQIKKVEDTAYHRALAGSTYEINVRPDYSQNPVIQVIPGPHDHYFDSECLNRMRQSAYQISASSNRMGYRLIGPEISPKSGKELLSQGMVIGQIQIPPDGQPIVMMPDHPTTGGYASIAVVTRADQPLLAQSTIGMASIRFTPVDIDTAKQALRDAIKNLDGLESGQEESWHYL